LKPNLLYRRAIDKKEGWVANLSAMPQYLQIKIQDGWARIRTDTQNVRTKSSRWFLDVMRMR